VGIGDVRFHLLGEVRATSGGEQVDLGPVRQRSVLAALLVDVNEPVSMDDLVDRVWGDEPPETARNTLYSYLSRLRHLVVIERTRGGGQRLVAEPTAVDLVEFRAHVDAGRYEQALALWRGEPLAGLSSPWAVQVRQALAGERFAAVLGLAEQQLQAGKHVEVVTVLTPLAADHPLDERLAALLMKALTAAGRQAEALRRYERLRRDLADELGVDPGPELQGLYQRILRGETMTAKTVPVPHQLLGPPPSFVGRTAELARLDEAGGIVVISGAGGIGKTWLALHWAHRDAHRFPDGQLYVNLRGFDPSGRPMSVESALRGFLEGLGVLPSELPSELDAQSALYRSLLAGRRMLVLVDNAVDSAHVTPLLPGGGSTVVVTSRDQLSGLVTAHGARRLTLDALPDEDATALLAARIGADRLAAEPVAVHELVDSCAGMPLALSIVAGRAQEHPEFPLAALAAQLREARLNALDEDDPLASVRAVLSWSTHTLKPSQARLFALLGLAPGSDIGVQAAAALSGGTEAEVGRTLRALERVSLVQQHVPGRYRMHDLVRLYAAEQQVPRSDRNAALTGVVNYYTYGAYAVGRKLFPHRAASPLTHMPAAPIEYTPPDADAAWAWFEAENACVMATARLAMRMGWHAAVWQQAWYLGPLRSRHALLQDDHEAWSMALDAAGHIGNTAARAYAHVGLGFACQHLGDLDHAVSNMELALDLLASTDLNLEKAIAHAGLSYVLRSVGRHEEALDHARKGLALLEPIGGPVITAQARSQVGELLVALGENEAGRATLEQALAVFREHGDTDSEAITLGNVARSHYQQGHLTEALTLYRKVIGLHGATGNSNALGLMHSRLGDILLELGDRAGAAEQWRLAVASHVAHHKLTEAAAIRSKLADIDSSTGPQHIA
jgi:DNA-binding SARP family transcriptional activator/predicted negative regulator of RcsB-dependent stress response